jgi:hypothetical protein
MTRTLLTQALCVLLDRRVKPLASERARRRSRRWGVVGSECLRELWRTSAAGHPTGGARRLGSVVSGDAHVCACVLRREARDHVQCDAPRFCGIPSKWNIEPQLIVPEEDAALTFVGSRECDESLHLARWPNFEFHARSIGPYSETAEAVRGTLVNAGPLGSPLVGANSLPPG